MGLYLIQASYTSESWAALVRNPQDARARVEAVVEKLGGTLHGIWYAFGEYDVIAIGEYPDNVTGAAAALVVAAGGALKSGKTTPLLSMEEGVAAMRKAGEASGVYSKPG